MEEPGLAWPDLAGVARWAVAETTYHVTSKGMMNPMCTAIMLANPGFAETVMAQKEYQYPVVKEIAKK
ncbi:hypothetical protein E4U55_003664 [Claviceps digitariae]|nr:hypothetical protein E4U55_003664 [Claviceps digitariae]